MREEIADDPFMKRCVWSGDMINVSWEHCWIYAGRQINEKWAIIPLRLDLNVNMERLVKDWCQFVSLNRATEEDLKKYPRKDWKQIKKYLFKKYENKNPYTPFVSQQGLARA